MPSQIERELATLRSLASRGDFVSNLLIKTFDALRASQKTGNTARFTSTANRASLSGLASTSLDGTPIEKDVILLKDQTDAKQNGLYTATAGTWTRVTDDNGDVLLGSGMQVTVREGSTLADTIWQCTSDNFTVGVDNIVFAQMGTGGDSGSPSVDDADGGYQFLAASGTVDLSVSHTEVLTTTSPDVHLTLPDGTRDKMIHTFLYQGTHSSQPFCYIHANLKVTNQGGPPLVGGQVILRSRFNGDVGGSPGNTQLGASAQLRWNAAMSLWIPELASGIALFSPGEVPE